MGAWIEIINVNRICTQRRSLPLWERGLKSAEMLDTTDFLSVAPLVGAWIEIIGLYSYSVVFSVAPLVGAWIEINDNEFI